MSTEEFLCARCAKYTITCCQRTEIFTTLGDLQRIRDFTGSDDFHEYVPVKNPAYADQDDDPVWRDHVLGSDLSREVLKHEPNGDCTFLGEKGCVLPLEIRPLICRLYPFDYNAEGILNELAEGCPVELLRPGQGLLEALDMKVEDARRWHQQLYSEILSQSALV